MKKRVHRLLVTILTLAMAVSPLSGVFAGQVMAASSEDAGCADMQHDMHSPEQMADMQDTAPSDSHDCGQDCKGSCCDGACSACTHAAPALASAMTALRCISNTLPTVTPLYGFTERLTAPPFRPPVSLQS